MSQNITLPAKSADHVTLLKVNFVPSFQLSQVVRHRLITLPSCPVRDSPQFPPDYQPAQSFAFLLSRAEVYTGMAQSYRMQILVAYQRLADESTR